MLLQHFSRVLTNSHVLLYLNIARGLVCYFYIKDLGQWLILLYWRSDFALKQEKDTIIKFLMFLNVFFIQLDEYFGLVYLTHRPVTEKTLAI